MPRALRSIIACWLLSAMSAQAAGDGAEIHSGSWTLRVTALADDILRVRAAAGGALSEDASWAVVDDMRQRSVHVNVKQNADSAEFKTAVMAVRIERSPLRIIVSDLKGQVITADKPTVALEQNGNGFVLHKDLSQKEHIFGLGDKTGPLDRRGQAFTLWNTDAYRFQESTDPLYKSIPFFVSTGGSGGSYGILLDNTWRSWFDFGKQDPQILSFGSAGGAIDYYVIYGPSVRRVVERYTDLTGKPPLVPAWGLGFQQSRYSYMSAEEVHGIADRLRSDHIPADVIWLDIDFQDRNRPFTVNPKEFPDLAGLAGDLRQQGLRLVTITDLHIAAAPDQHYAPYDSGVAGDHFLRRPDGSLYVGKVWPGPSVFPDFTRRETRAWWGSLYRDFVAAGVAGFWNDMNEPSVFETPTITMPLDTQHRIAEPGFEPRSASHAEIHNVYGMLNSRATFEGQRQLNPDERSFVMTRASYAGGQRYAVTWTGDNSSSWNHLKLSISMLLNLGLSGFAYSGADVGGFIGAPSPELMTRWIEIAAFSPIFRAHSEKGTPHKELWVDGPEHLRIRRQFVEHRYRLLPYLYALADENARTGAPLMRPLFYDFSDALDMPCNQPTAFMLGDRLLIAPSPTLESPEPYSLCLPAGHWYDYWSGQPVATKSDSAASAAQSITITPVLDQLPVFVRAGAILPSQALIQSTSETPQGPLFLDIYPGEDCHGTIYADDGHSMGYTRQSYLRQQVRCTQTAVGIDIDFDPREGGYQPWWQQVTVRVHHWTSGARVTLDGKQVQDLARRDGLLSVTIADPSRKSRLSLRTKPGR
ncbi:MAG TPA: TIM-barrel domain-containing protein [Steroidobacteraceae bacterium]|nr:TIM-barrel domain-containing protein [Steroidobacteraceae bacterium]